MLRHATFVVFLVAGFLFFIPSTTHAYKPFDYGGNTLWFFPACNGFTGELVHIGPPALPPGFYYFQYGYSALKPFGPPKYFGQLNLGRSLGIVTCWLFVPPLPPIYIGQGYLVTPNAGTSAVPAP